MSQHINHRRGGERYQDNGPRWENHNPMAGCNSTHVARCRKGWQEIRRRSERRTVAQIVRRQDSVDMGMTESRWLSSTARLTPLPAAGEGLGEGVTARWRPRDLDLLPGRKWVDCRRTKPPHPRRR